MYFLNQHFLLEFNPISARLYSHRIPYYIQSSFSQSAQRCCWLNPMKPQRCCHSMPWKILKIHNPSKIHENPSRINPKPSKIGQIHPALSPFTGHWSPKTVPLPRGRGAWRRRRAAAERPRPARRPRRGGRATAPRNPMGNQVMIVFFLGGLWKNQLRFNFPAAVLVFSIADGLDDGFFSMSKWIQLTNWLVSKSWYNCWLFEPILSKELMLVICFQFIYLIQSTMYSGGMGPGWF